MTHILASHDLTAEHEPQYFQTCTASFHLLTYTYDVLFISYWQTYTHLLLNTGDWQKLKNLRRPHIHLKSNLKSVSPFFSKHVQSHNRLFPLFIYSLLWLVFQTFSKWILVLVWNWRESSYDPVDLKNRSNRNPFCWTEANRGPLLNLRLQFLTTLGVALQDYYFGYNALSSLKSYANCNGPQRMHPNEFGDHVGFLCTTHVLHIIIKCHHANVLK